MRYICFILLFSIGIFAKDFGSVLKIKGTVFNNKTPLSLKSKVKIGDIITTKNNSIVALRFDKSQIVINENSTLKIMKDDLVQQKKGEIFYQINPFKKGTRNIKKIAPNKFNIIVKNATIGIRGTNFIVKADKRESVYLREGKLHFTAATKDFKLYIKKEQEEFEQYKRDLENGFNQYKNQSKYQFEKESREFNLKKGWAVVLNEERAYKKELKDKQRIFRFYDNFLGK